MLALSVLFVGTAAVCAIGAFQTTATHFSLPAGQQFTNAGRQLLSISPDGSQIVYVANNQLHLKKTTERDSRPPWGPTPETLPIRCSRLMGSLLLSGLAQTSRSGIAVTGGTAGTSGAANPYGMSWGADDQIVFGRGRGGSEFEQPETPKAPSL
jgi:hypothetical protein